MVTLNLRRLGYSLRLHEAAADPFLYSRRRVRSTFASLSWLPLSVFAPPASRKAAD